MLTSSDNTLTLDAGYYELITISTETDITFSKIHLNVFSTYEGNGGWTAPYDCILLAVGSVNPSTDGRVRFLLNGSQVVQGKDWVSIHQTANLTVLPNIKKGDSISIQTTDTGWNLKFVAIEK